jgi:ribonuclease R
MLKGVNLAALEAEYASAQSRPAAPVRQSDAVSRPWCQVRPHLRHGLLQRAGRLKAKSLSPSMLTTVPRLPPPSPVQAARGSSLGAVKSKVAGKTSKPRRKP